MAGGAEMGTKVTRQDDEWLLGLLADRKAGVSPTTLAGRHGTAQQRISTATVRVVRDDVAASIKGAVESEADVRAEYWP